VGSTLGPNSQYGSCTAIPSVNDTQTVISKITLPNGQAFNFYYGTDVTPHSAITNTYGLISEIDYPEGGWVQYTWKPSDTKNEVADYPALINQSGTTCSTDPSQNCPTPVPGGCGYSYQTRVVASRKVSFGGSSPVLTQTFTYSTAWAPPFSGNTGSTIWTSKTTTVTNTDNVLGKSAQTVYTYSSVNGPTQPFSNVTVNQIPVESSIKYYDWANTTAPIRTVNKTWYDQYDLASEQTVLETGQSSKITYCYVGTSCVPAPNVIAQVQEKDEFDFGATNPNRKTVTTYQSFPGTLGIIADAPCKVVVSDVNGNRVAETDYYYDGGTTLCGTPGTPSVTGVTGLVTGTHDETNFGSTSTMPRGNLTKKVVWASTGTSPTTTYTYDETGQVLSVTDACGNSSCSDMTGSTHATTYSYGDSYTVLSGGQNVSYTPSGNTNAYLTKVTNPLSQSTTFKYDFNSGELTSATDPNSQSTTYLYNDSFARPTQVNYPDGGQKTIAYNDSPYNTSTPSPSVTTTTKILSNVNEVTTAAYDGMGHLVETIFSSDPNGIDYTGTSYYGTGQPYQVTNPHRATSSSTDGTTTTAYDGLGRITKVTQADGSVITTSFSGNCTTVTDEASHARKSCLDGLGRMTSVWEDPGSSPHLNYETDYTYDVLGNLTNVNQKGSSGGTARTRTFQYDSLSRLTSAQNPESGTILYNYDANSNVSSRVAPSPNQPSTGTAKVTTSYSYDVLNRLTYKSYTDAYSSNPATATASFAYDGAALTGCNPPTLTDSYPKGRRTAMCDGSGATKWAHDALGRILIEKRTISGQTQTISYTYNSNGSLATLTYPGRGKVLTYTTLGDGRAAAVQDISGSINYVQNAAYAPSGAVSAMINGQTSSFTGINFADTFNSRLQPLQIYVSTATISSSTLSQLKSLPCPTTVATIMSRSYNFAAGSSDNGNTQSITNCLDSTRTQSFTYDALNRIASAQSSGPQWGENFSIDAWGNLTTETGISGKNFAEGLSVSVNASNQFTTASGFTYDAAGNMATNGTSTYRYNAENQLAYTNAGYNYYYDGDGNRVAKSNGSTGTLYWRGPTGDPISESSLAGTSQAEYVFFADRRVARRDVSSNSVHYYFSDHLGSHAVVENATGSSCEQDIDYFPYGNVAHDYCPAVSRHYRFTGKERDAESGLDNFGKRYNASSLGRFMQTDPIWVKADRMLDPQRLNLYSYVRNNPLKLTDPSGMDVVLRTCSGSSTMTQCFNQVQNGLKKEDRSHVHLVEGDGKNGFKKGQYGITVDADYKGSAGNFSTLQKLANDHSATANVDVLKPTDSFNVRISVSYNAKSGLGNLSTSSMTANDFEGYTFFPPGKNSPQPFSADEDTDVVVNNSNDVPATIHHELRHVLLGDFGRLGNNAKHGLPEVEKQTKAAEDEAHQNEKEQ